ncbi:hypothetical protein ACFXTI_029109 [Malus domestica]
MRVKHSSSSILLVSKEIAEIREPSPHAADNGERKMGNEKLKEAPLEVTEIVDIERGKGNQSWLESDGSGPHNIGWGRWYSLKELEIATHGFFSSERNGRMRIRHRLQRRAAGRLCRGRQEPSE